MRTLVNVAAVLAALVVGVVAVAASLFLFATRDMCGNEIFSEVLSPDREHKAVVFQRDCGATTGFSTQISIVSAGGKLKNKSGNIFIIDGHPADVSIETVWLSDNELKIEGTFLSSANLAEKEWGFVNKIKVVYGAGSS